MKKFILGTWACFVLVGFSACSKDTAQPQASSTTQSPSPTTNNTVKEPIVVGTSSSCEIAPKQLTLSGKTYDLAENAKAEEGPTKLAYVKCDKGTFTIGDAGDAFVIYSAGASNDIYLSGGQTGNGLHKVYTLKK